MMKVGSTTLHRNPKNRTLIFSHIYFVRKNMSDALYIPNGNVFYSWAAAAVWISLNIWGGRLVGKIRNMRAKSLAIRYNNAYVLMKGVLLKLLCMLCSSNIYLQYFLWLKNRASLFELKKGMRCYSV